MGLRLTTRRKYGQGVEIKRKIENKKMSKRQKVAYSGMGGEEPSFLKAFKARVGYQEPDNEKDMEAKKAKLDQMLNDDSLPDELPQVVSLGKGVSEADAACFLEAKAAPAEAREKEKEEAGEKEEEKLEEKMQEKTKPEETEEENDAKLIKTKTQKVASIGGKEKEKKKKKKSKMKAVKNTALLSFDD